MSGDYAARLSPFSAPTIWRLEDGVLIQQRGKAQTRQALSGLTRLTLAPASARRPHPALILAFGRRRLTIPGAGFSLRGVEAYAAAFSAFARNLAAQAAAAAPSAAFVAAAGVDRRVPVIWTIVLLGAGALMMMLASASSVAGGLGLSLAARLVFAALLLGAALPWLGSPDRPLDPRQIPPALLA